MANASFQKPPKPIEINKFLGLNESIGNTEIEMGEFSFLENFRITKNYKLQKRPGHQTFINFTTTSDVQGIWQGQIASKNILLVAWNGTIYEYDLDIATSTVDIADLITEGTVTTIGSMTDAKTCIFWFYDKIYFMNGTEYKEYDGTTFQDVVPYVPTIAINAPPSGGGTLFEEINLLTGTKTQTFVGDGTALYQLAEVNIDADAVTATVNGVAKVEGVDFTVNRVLGQVTFNVAPASNDAVSITWTKVIAGNADLVKNHKYGIDFGIDNDTNLFIWGNVNEKYTFRFSGIAKANYFPANSFVNVGSTEFSITDLKSNQQQLLVFKERATFIVKPSVNLNYADNTGLNPYNFGYEDLNEQVGNLAPKMVQLIEDTPVSLDGYSMWLWSITEVELQRNAKIISDRMKLSLQELDLSTAVTFNYQNQKEYWVNVDNVVYIWNYGNDTMYKYTNFEATQFLEYNDQIFYGSKGKVELVDEDFTADDTVLGTNIDAIGKLGFTDLGMLHLEKNMRDQWVSIEPASRTSVDLTFVTDRKNEANSKTFTTRYVLFDFGDVDFADFSFLTNRNPQPRRARNKVKKFTYLQTVFKNNSNDETLTVLKLMLPVKAHRYSG